MDIDFSEVEREVLNAKSLPTFRDYLITRATYHKDEPIKIQRKKAIEKVKSKISGDMGYPKILVIWDNLPRRKYLEDVLGYSEKHLLTRFCEYVRPSKMRSKLYIESPNTLTNIQNPSFTEVLENLYLIWKVSTIVPKFLEDDFLLPARQEEMYKEELEEKIKKSKVRTVPFGPTDDNCDDEFDEKYIAVLKQKRKEFVMMMKENFMEEKNREFYERFFSSIESLVKMTGAKIDEEEPINFIDLYIKWQKHTMSAEECILQLVGCSRATWYRYGTNFENSPIYETYMILFSGSEYIEPKRGHVPDPFVLLPYYKKLLALEDGKDDCQSNIEQKLYENFDEIKAKKDVYRCIQACVKSIAVLKSKGSSILNEKLQKYGLTEEDVTIEGFKLWHSPTPEDYAWIKEIGAKYKKKED